MAGRVHPAVAGVMEDEQGDLETSSRRGRLRKKSRNTVKWKEGQVGVLRVNCVLLCNRNTLHTGAFRVPCGAPWPPLTRSPRCCDISTARLARRTCHAPRANPTIIPSFAALWQCSNT